MPIIRRRCFISYHHVDQDEVDDFIEYFDHDNDVFIARGLGQSMAQEIVDSTDTDYVMRRIRELYIRNSTVTIVLLGKCTWARRYVDWEIQASLRAPQNGLPNGLLGIKLPSFASDTPFPERFNKNLLTAEKKAAGEEDCFARWIAYPQKSIQLWDAIDGAFQRRATHSSLIVNPRERFSNNRKCT